MKNLDAVNRGEWLVTVDAVGKSVVLFAAKRDDSGEVRNEIAMTPAQARELAGLLTGAAVLASVPTVS